MSELESAYKKWTVTRQTKTGYSVRCKKGLWRVDAPDLESADREGRNYFWQYFTDGEYE